MGIGSTVKNMLANEDNNTANRRGSTNASNTSEKQDNNLVGDRSSRQLPPGTGPGTSGKPAVASEVTPQSDLEHSKTASGYGTDAAAAMGGTLAGTHQGRGASPGNSRPAARNASGPSTGPGFVSDAATGSGHRNSTMGGDQAIPGPAPVTYAKASGVHPDTEAHPLRYGNLDTDADVKQPSAMLPTTYHEPIGQGLGLGRSGVLEEDHSFGHSKRESMPTGKTQEDTNQLRPVFHERVRHLEFEEIAHVKNRERHIHHIQHHTQPVTVSQELEERLREIVHPVTRVKEIHASKPEDGTLFEGQIYHNRDIVSHVEKERKVIDKGTTVNETIHHHVHHVIQPVIEKETINRERIVTTIPIHEVTQEAPVVHQSQSHAPVAMEQFLKKGGNLEGVPQADIVRKVLHTGKCVREIDGHPEAKNAQETTTLPTTSMGTQRSDQANVASSRN